MFNRIYRSGRALKDHVANSSVLVLVENHFRSRLIEAPNISKYILWAGLQSYAAWSNPFARIEFARIGNKYGAVTVSNPIQVALESGLSLPPCPFDDGTSQIDEDMPPVAVAVNIRYTRVLVA